MLHKNYDIVMELLEWNKDPLSNRNYASRMLYASINQNNHEFAEKLCCFPVYDMKDDVTKKTTLFKVLTAMQRERDRYDYYNEAQQAIVRAYEKVAIALIKNKPILTEEIVVGTENTYEGEKEKRTTVLALLGSDPVFDNCVLALSETELTVPVSNALLIWAAKRGHAGVIEKLHPQPVAATAQSVNALLMPAAAAVVPGFEATQQQPSGKPANEGTAQEANQDLQKLSSAATFF